MKAIKHIAKSGNPDNVWEGVSGVEQENSASLVHNSGDTYLELDGEYLGGGE